jgi:hypothetical protein
MDMKNLPQFAFSDEGVATWQYEFNGEVQTVSVKFDSFASAELINTLLAVVYTMGDAAGRAEITAVVNSILGRNGHDY